ncbi:hypothetical protein ASPBRDRAFT_190973 [Aspergillus brasiliensis CBS 101740]|uniref:Uncharacterized protein n=1 Tax=Aspergillus brasiliensis (strain CBS 101740 / IMI 381727 / IBT 21946) TaxID=767769 RepID=A0A1L9V1L8_ASPBC|nr:hypothetical protein ASPBRDRAFT_190973 [Aspergillus brasiliensis CBS 101740]
MERPTQVIHKAIFLPGSLGGAGPRKSKVEKKKRKEICRLRAAILKEEEELKRKKKIGALEASILADETKVMTMGE